MGNWGDWSNLVIFCSGKVQKFGETAVKVGVKNVISLNTIRFTFFTICYTCEGASFTHTTQKTKVDTTG